MRKVPVPAILLILCLSLIPLSAQDAYVPGRDWRILRAESADVIFPAELSREARRGAALLDAVLPELADTLGTRRLRRWTLVLNADNTESNGYVTAGPRYSLWYQGTGQEALLQGDWFSLLAAHEGRHMVQVDRMLGELGGLLYALLGDQGTVYMLKMVYPEWLLEGDAVLSETLNTSFGRGRDPGFTGGMEELARETAGAGGYRRTYRRLLNRSWRLDLPGPYEYGYFLVTHIRRTRGPGALDRIFGRAAAFPVPALGFFLAVREETGLSLPALFREMMEELASFAPGGAASPAEVLASPGKGEVFRFSSPGTAAAGAEKAGLAWVLSSRDDRPRMVVSGLEGEVLRSFPFPGPVSTPLSIREGRALFSLAGADPRWPALKRADLHLMDLATGEIRRLTRTGRYLSPALGPRGKAAAVRLSPGGTAVVLLDPSTGRETAVFAPPEGTVPSGLVWDEEGSRLALILNGPEGRALALLEAATGEFSLLTGFGGETLSGPAFWKNWILFVSGYTGRVEIHALNRETGEIRQVTVRSGTTSRPLVLEDRLVSVRSAGTAGEELVSFPLDPSLWLPREEPSPAGPGYFQEILETEELYRDRLIPLAELPENQEPDYPVESWSPGRGLVRIHSWGPDAVPFLLDPSVISLSLQSRDILGTLETTLSGFWNLNEETPGVQLLAELRSFYPVFDFGGVWRRRDSSGWSWDEGGLLLQARLPLDFSLGLRSRLLELRFGGMGFLYRDHPYKERELFLLGGLSFSDTLPGGIRRPVPLWGLEGALDYTGEVTDSQNRVLTGKVRGYLPGLFRNQGFTLEGSGESRRGTRESGLLFSRGYPAEAGELSWKLSLDGDFPLAYPDLPLGGLLFLQRLRGNLFADFYRLDGAAYDSAGLGLFLDWTILDRRDLTGSAGIRGVWRFRDSRPVLEWVILGVAL